MNKKVIGLLTVLSVHALAVAVDPFSKITVQSERAVFEKEKDVKSEYRLQYQGAVKVGFADASTVNSDLLDVFATPKKNGDKKTSGANSLVKKIVFKKNVCFKRQNQIVHADEVEIRVAEKKCFLTGNVKIEQIKKDEKDIPFSTACDHASFNMAAEEITLEGTPSQPVSTTIELAGSVNGLKGFMSKKTTGTMQS